ncbi:GMP synthase (glutamine-hydrolysing) [Sphingomonas jejuensis]|uniref:GMP synthase (Glutamine-hydrolysing) n=1 Tax=Sphingomonas jejuensis TaxID=904715 RepID=A0ABX0XMM3_9SPHN|nr:type 1 glutamine amidotransferase [Sphingomonas jejuensis]NJC34485.1 GMP synthase (glutamine-hydrolysing) [Sphingomonas jejuensis]
MRHYLVAESETQEERDERREHAGKSSGETYAATLKQIDPDCEIEIIAPADADQAPLEPGAIARFDAVFLTGSPLHVYNDTPEVRRQLSFMRAVFASGTPSFGSCAGLQVAVAVAGGSVRKMPQRMEAGVARRITATDAGKHHPMLAGRPAVWDAPAVHGDEVAELPGGAIHLAGNDVTDIQAVEIRHDRGIFWGVQYHPELALGEVAAALRRQASSLVDSGLARDEDAVARQADLFDALHRDPEDRRIRWELGVDSETADEPHRRRELLNFISALPSIDGRVRS